MIRKQSGLTVTCNMSYASRWESDHFPQTMLAVEGLLGGVSLGTDFEICIDDKSGVHREQVSIPRYDWANPAYALIQASMIDCHRHLLASLRGEAQAETTCHDNLRTLELVYAAYESAEFQLPLRIGGAGCQQNR